MPSMHRSVCQHSQNLSPIFTRTRPSLASVPKKCTQAWLSRSNRGWPEQKTIHRAFQGSKRPKIVASAVSGQVGHILLAPERTACSKHDLNYFLTHDNH